jgi:hypothetical protein
VCHLHTGPDDGGITAAIHENIRQGSVQHVITHASLQVVNC